MSPKPFWTRTAAALATTCGLALLVSSGASAQGSVTADVTAEILTALTVSQTQALDFGQVATSASTGTAVVTNAGVQTCTGGATCVTSGQEGTFDVDGHPSTAVDITLPANATVTQDSLPNTATMTVDTFNDDQSGSMTLGLLGTGTFAVGATLNVGANQTVDTYTGTYVVNVDYQ